MIDMEVLTFEYDGKPFVTVDDKKVLRIDWRKFGKLSLNERHSILLNRFVYKEPKKVKYLFKQQVFQRICDSLRKKGFLVSYTDVECYIVSRFCTLDGAIPGFGQLNDHDTYCNKLRYFCDSELNAYERRNGSSCWNSAFD